LIEASHYVLRSCWQVLQPRALEQNAFLKTHSRDEYDAWDLGLTDGAAEETKASASCASSSISVMAVNRIKPNIGSSRSAESRSFYTGVIGLEELEGLDWILFFGTDEAQLSVMELDAKAHAIPTSAFAIRTVRSSTSPSMREARTC
jgi:hypothetical protein